MADTLRRGLGTALAATAILGAFLVLAAVRFSADLEGALRTGLRDPRPFALPGPVHRGLAAFYNGEARGSGPSPRSLPRALASCLAPPRAGRVTAVRRTAFAVRLRLAYRQDTILSHYLDRALLGRIGGVPVEGFGRGARVYFGVMAERLNLGEALLLAHLSQDPEGGALTVDLPEAIRTRDRLLLGLHDAGVLSQSEYELEVSRPLSLASDHRPVR